MSHPTRYIPSYSYPIGTYPVGEIIVATYVEVFQADSLIDATSSLGRVTINNTPFVGQTAFKIILNTGISLTDASAVYIKYLDPSKESGIWTAEVESLTDGQINYTIQSSSDLSMSGTWKVWAYVVFSGGTVAPGCVTSFDVLKEGASCV